MIKYPLTTYNPIIEYWERIQSGKEIVWMMGKDEDYINNAYSKGYITEAVRDVIFATPKFI